VKIMPSLGDRGLFCRDTQLLELLVRALFARFLDRFMLRIIKG
jgi:hypothetical protein